MEWLVDVAMLVAKEGQPVTWVTPLGLPVQQPYRSNSGFQVRGAWHVGLLHRPM